MDSAVRLATELNVSTAGAVSNNQNSWISRISGDSFGGSGSTALFAGGLAAILASTCCLGPLILISLGFSGAWIGNLTVLEPYRPFFIVAAVLALSFAGRQIFRPAHPCNPGEVCALPRARGVYKSLFWSCAILVLVALVYPYVARFFY
ncbi:MAG: mercuric ion transporter MerT [Acidobacteria bacterium]|nr:MAG: mercuric ion transporter MerT [Acidobacteriota bacterium]